MIYYKETTYGFDYGSAKVSRLCSDEKKGWILLKVETPKACIRVYATKTGKIRVFNLDNGEWKEQ